jgi:hypothetical protein
MGTLDLADVKRWYLPSIALLGLAACGGQSSGESRAPAAGSGSTESAGGSSGGAESGGTGGVASASGGSGGAGMPGAGGGAGTGNVAGMPSSAGAGGSGGHANRNERVACFDWSDVMNEPKPRQTGILACPQYSDIDWVDSQGNCVAKADQAPVPPEPGVAEGDCCYHYTYLECR